MEWLAADFTRRAAIHCSLQCSDDLELDEEQVIVLFRATREALANIQVHTKAKSVDIIVERSGSDHVLIVRDDRKGFDCTTSRKGKLGLLLIHERARTVDGTVSIHGEPGRGTSFELRISAVPVRL